MSLVASVLHLDRRSVNALRITDAYSLHRVVYSLYEDVREAEDKQASTASGIMFADQGGDHRGRKILMLADREPMSAVDGVYGEVRTKPIPEDFLEHDSYRFKVVVNPTRRDSASRKLVPVRVRDAVAQWFRERAEASWGFQVSAQNLQVDSIDVLQFKDKKHRPVTIAQAHVQGVLRVTDKEVFANSFAKGIGRARAYGCGLLQIVPLTNNFFE
jgi:CRISPR system Cascade subunit CasE